MSRVAAERHAEEQRKRQCQDHQFQRGRQPIRQVGGYRAVREQGRAEVTAHCVAEEIDVLLTDRSVRAELRLNVGDHLLGGEWPGDEIGRIPAGEAGEEESRRSHPE